MFSPSHKILFGSSENKLTDGMLSTVNVILCGMMHVLDSPITVTICPLFNEAVENVAVGDETP